MVTEANDEQLDQKLLGDVLEHLPAPALPAADKARLAARLSARLSKQAAPSEPSGIRAIRAEDGAWHRLARGVHIKPLRADLNAGTQTSLWRIDQGASVPRHAHHHEEECLVLYGQILMAGIRYGAGDYVLANDGSEHPEFRAETDTTLLIRGQLDAGLRPLFQQALGLVA